MNLRTSQRSFDIRTVGDRRGRAAVTLIVLLCVAAAGFAAYWFLLRGSGSGGDAATKLYTRMSPTATRVIIQPAKLFDSPFVATGMSILGGMGRSTSDLRSEVEAQFGFRISDVEALAVAFDDDDRGISMIVLGDVTVATGHSALTMLKDGVWSLLGSPAAAPPAFTQFDERHVVGGLGELGAAAVGHFEQPTPITDRLTAMIRPVDAGAAVWGTHSFDVPLDVVSLLDLPPIPIPGLKDTGKVIGLAFSVETTDALDVTCTLLLDRPADAAATAGRALLAFATRFGGGVDKAFLSSVDIRSEGNVLIFRGAVDEAVLQDTFGSHGSGSTVSPLPWLNF